MIRTLKQKLYKELVDAGVSMTDNWSFESGEFPRAMLRLSNARRLTYRNTQIETISFTLDVFSKYAGEKEVIDIVEKVTDLFEAIDDAKIMGVQLTSFHILDDKEKGPVQKHGVAVFQFVLAVGEEET